MITDDEAERVSIIMEGCKVSQSYAQRLHAEQLKAMHCPADHMSAKVARLRELAESHRRPVELREPKREAVAGAKMLAAGEIE